MAVSKKSQGEIDKKLVAQAVLGDKSAFEALVQTYQTRVTKLVMRYVRDPHEASDITQDVFLKVYKSLSQFRGDSAFYTWLYRIAVNTAKNQVMRNNKRFIEADVEEVDFLGLFKEYKEDPKKWHDYIAPEKIVIEDEIEEAILDSIEKLPNNLKIAISLRELDGLSYEEISEIMGCPIGTVRSRIFRARSEVERKLGPIFREKNHVAHEVPISLPKLNVSKRN